VIKLAPEKPRRPLVVPGLWPVIAVVSVFLTLIVVGIAGVHVAAVFYHPLLWMTLFVASVWYVRRARWS
jgi:hypothetical protein